MSSKKMTLNAAGDAATVADAEIADIFTTLFSSGECVTGGYKYLQTGLLVLGSAMVQKKVSTGAFGMPFTA